MTKIGISVKLDVKKLDKARFFAAQSGALYVDLTMFLDTDNVGQYGDHGFITQSTSKEEREANVQMPILGNGKIFYGLQELSGGQAPQQRGYQQPAPAQQPKPQNHAHLYQQAPPQHQAPKVNPQAPIVDFDDETLPF